MEYVSILFTLIVTLSRIIALGVTNPTITYRLISLASLQVIFITNIIKTTLIVKGKYEKLVTID